MVGFLSKTGLVAIISVIIYVIKKLSDYIFYKKAVLVASNEVIKSDGKIIKAAEAFSKGAPISEIKNILNDFIDFDEEDIEEIISKSIPHKTDDDGGFRAFIENADSVLGEDIYV